MHPIRTQNISLESLSAPLGDDTRPQLMLCAEHPSMPVDQPHSAPSMLVE
jgi:hypothetical protein